LDKLKHVDIWNVIAERKIQEAMEEGAFDHLEGTGQPFTEEINPYEDPSERLANRILKNAGITPDWITEGREIDRQVAGLDALPSEVRLQRIAELNRRIAMFNLKTPVSSTQRSLVLK
jgi:hypothetical protein